MSIFAQSLFMEEKVAQEILGHFLHITSVGLYILFPQRTE
jgi:hypothetical protein